LDPEDTALQSAARALEPTLSALGDLLAEGQIGSDTAQGVFAAMAEVYVAGYRDGQRQTVGQIAPEAARRGLHLRLAPELEEPGQERT
jgi:hypothetical protein